MYPRKPSPISMPLLEEVLLTSSAGTLDTFMVLHAGLGLCPIADSDRLGPCPQTLWVSWCKKHWTSHLCTLPSAWHSVGVFKMSIKWNHWVLKREWRPPVPPAGLRSPPAQPRTSSAPPPCPQLKVQTHSTRKLTLDVKSSLKHYLCVYFCFLNDFLMYSKNFNWK